MKRLKTIMKFKTKDQQTTTMIKMTKKISRFRFLEDMTTSGRPLTCLSFAQKSGVEPKSSFSPVRGC